MNNEDYVSILPAFPVKMEGPCQFAGIEVPKGVIVQSGGITRRDYFAAKAMAALIASRPNSEISDTTATAKRAYAYADAMIEEQG